MMIIRDIDNNLLSSGEKFLSAWKNNLKSESSIKI